VARDKNQKEIGEKKGRSKSMERQGIDDQVETRGDIPNKG
jgi:hypothetical protein